MSDQFNENKNSTDNNQSNNYDSLYTEINNNQDFNNNQNFNKYQDFNNNQNSDKKSNRFIVKAGKLLGTAVCFGIVASITFQGVNTIGNQSNIYLNDISNDASNNEPATTVSPANSITTTTTTQISGNITTVTDISDMVSNVMPSIVAINCTITQTDYDWFNNPYSRESTGSGSGIIISKTDKELLIVTNNHVVENATNVQVTFCNDVTATATIKGTDTDSDLAVVSIPIKDLDEDTINNIKIAVLGDSNRLKVGEPAIAIGNALGSGQSVTKGVISALNREVQLEDKNMTLIQTDAAINPGNSGGALLNLNGEVIGINSVKYASSDVDGMGFAIPISTASPIITELMNYEEIPENEQAALGITGSTVTNQLISGFNMPAGVYVVSVSENSAAENAGLKIGDIITEFAGHKIESMENLQNCLANKRGGDEVIIKVQRQGNNAYEELEINVILGTRDTSKSNSDNNNTTTTEQPTQNSNDPYSYFYGNDDNNSDFYKYFFGN